MADLTSLPLQLDVKKSVCRAIIESPKGFRNKFNYDPDSGLFKLAGLLPEGMSFPYDFGFLPSTLGEDGDPLDVLLLMDEPAFTGCLVRSRLIGVIAAKQTERDGKKQRNDRLIAVPIKARLYGDCKNLTDLNRDRLREIQEFFVSYNRVRKKSFDVLHVYGANR